MKRTVKSAVLFFIFFRSFGLTQKNQKVKAQKTGPSHGLSKWVSFTAGSAFFESKRSAKAPHPAMNLNPLSSSFWLALPRFWASACAPNPIKFCHS